MLVKLKEVIKSQPILRFLFSPARTLVYKYWHNSFYWMSRTHYILTCPDIKFIQTVPDAGKVKEGSLIMHNGLKIEPLSYYGQPMLKLLRKSKGIHEPQEERIFLEVLKIMPKGALMLELGSYWAFYSMCFNKAVPEPHCYLIEPTDFGLEFGQKNFSRNNMNGDFTQAYIGKEPGVAPDGIKVVSIDDFVNEKQIPFIDILHSDIQGFEAEMLEGAKNTLSNKKVGYVFISTHTNDLHARCEQILKAHNFAIMASINLDESYSHDGLIVAVAPGYRKIENITLSKRK